VIARLLLQQATHRLREAGCDTPRLDAECLLAHAWRISRTQLFIRLRDDVPDSIAATFAELIARRCTREPLAYIIGRQEFWSRSFEVTPATLIPRPETEHLIEAALRHLPDRQRPWRCCDIGTGSGCIAVTLACELPATHWIATDISEAALQVARANAQRHQVAQRITWLCADMLHAFAPGARFDLLIANPPYVARHELTALAPELAFEPMQALSDQADGLSHLRHLLEHGATRLADHGLIIVETGPCGLPPTPSTLARIEDIRDLAGHLRGAVYRRR